MATSYRLSVNNDVFTVDVATLAGIQIRALAGVEPEWLLVEEGRGVASDRIIGDDDIVDLTGGPICLYTRPPATFGCANGHSAGHAS